MPPRNQLWGHCEFCNRLLHESAEKRFAMCEVCIASVKKAWRLGCPALPKVIAATALEKFKFSTGIVQGLQLISYKPCGIGTEFAFGSDLVPSTIARILESAKYAEIYAGLVSILPDGRDALAYAKSKGW